MRHYLYLLISMLLSFVSCETEIPEGEFTKEPPVSYQLSINKTTIVAKPEGTSETFSITSDDSWTVSVSESWINVSETTGAGDETITVTVEPNMSKEARSGSISVKGKSSGTKTISVSQLGKEFSLSVDKSEIFVGAGEATESFSITSDDSWIVNTSESWIKVSDTSGAGEKTITVDISLNSTTSSRTGTITVKGTNSGSIIITITQQGKPVFDTKGHDYIDLGLPSGLLWATCNVGATSSEDYGDYFAWGETSSKASYDWDTYKYCNGLGTTLTKYNSYDSYGAVDSKTVLDLEDDAAQVNWGGSWRMPTEEEKNELRDTNNCTWSWTTQNGISGYKVTSLTNGNSLFFPAAGYWGGSSLCDAGSYGLYWTSSVNSVYLDHANDLYFASDSVGISSYGRRCYGRSVRPVCTYSE